MFNRLGISKSSQYAIKGGITAFIATFFAVVIFLKPNQHPNTWSKSEDDRFADLALLCAFLGAVGGYVLGHCRNQPEEEEKKEVKPIPAKISNALFKPSDFDYTGLHVIPNPIGVLGLDIDDFLLDIENSIKAKQTIIINEEQIKQRIALAVKNKIRVVLITARYFNVESNKLDISDTHPDFYISVRRVIEKIGKENIAGVYFTNGKSKKPVLEHLHQMHFNGDDQFARCVAHCDDDLKYLRGAEKFFTILKPKDRFVDYLLSINVFITHCVAMSKRREATRSSVSEQKASRAPSLRART